MFKTFIAVLFLSVIAPLSSLAQEPLRIGVSAPLSGPAAPWGNDVKNVLLFAAKKLSDPKVSFLFEDDRCDPKTAVTIAQKFISVDRVKAVFSVCGAVTLAAGPIYQRAGILVMAPIATPSKISGLGDKIFRTGLSDEYAAQRLAEHTARSLKKIGVITEQNDYSVGMINDFQKYATTHGIEVVNEDFQSSDTDFRAQLLRLKSKSIAGLFVNTNAERSLASILEQTRSLGLKVPVYGAYLPGSSAFLALAGPAAEGIEFVDFPLAEDFLNADGRQLFKDYRDTVGAIQSWTYTFPSTFESYRVVTKALASAESPSDYIRHTSFSGIFGSYSFDTKGDMQGIKHSMRRIENGKSTPLPGNIASK